MDRKELRLPVTSQEEYLHDIALSLRQLTRHVCAQTSAVEDSGRVSLREPAIPAGFPGRKDLLAAGFNDLADLPRTVEELAAIQGIGDKTAGRILEALHYDKAGR